MSTTSPFNRKRTVGSAVFLDLTDEAKIDRLTYPISIDYVKDWTAVRAMSELVANAIDEDPTGFSVSWENGCLIIEDDGVGISEHGHLFGGSTKTNDQIGVNGEGFKICSLVLTRNPNIGRILFETVGYSFEPTIVKANLLPGAVRRQHGKAAPELLAMDFYPSDRARGTRITIECDEAFLEKVKSRFQHFKPGYKANANKGSILVDEPGRIYIGGVLVKENTDHKFGYDLPLATAKQAQNRDRNMIDGYILSNAVGALWLENDDDKVLGKWLEYFFAGSLKNDRERMPFNGITPIQRLKLRTIASKMTNLDKLFYLDGNRNGKEKEEALKKKGYKKVTVKGSSWSYKQFLRELGIKAAHEIMPDRVVKKVAPPRILKANETEYIRENNLDAKQKAIRDEAIDRMQGLFGKRAVGKVRLYTRTSRQTSYPGGWHGFYDETTKTISMNKSTLYNADNFFTYLLPLVALKLSKASSDARYNYNQLNADQLYARQLTEMLQVATRHLLASNAMPTASGKNKKISDSPAGTVKELVKKQMAAKGYKNAVEFEKATAVKINILRQMQNGKPVTQVKELEAACKALDLHWSVVFFALQTNTMGNIKRNKNGNFYGQSFRLYMQAIKHLESLGGEYKKLAKTVEDQTAGRILTPANKTDWHGVYKKLLKQQVKDI